MLTNPSDMFDWQQPLGKENTSSLDKLMEAGMFSMSALTVTYIGITAIFYTYICLEFYISI